MNIVQIKGKAVLSLGIAVFCLCLGCGGFAASAADPLPGRDADGSLNMGTRTGAARIETDPDTGDRLISTPDKKKHEETASPVVVTPEIHIPPMHQRPPVGRPPKPPR